MDMNDDDVIKSTLAMLEAVAKEKADKKLKKRSGKERDLDQARLYQHGYNEEKKKEGKYQVGLHLTIDNINTMDKQIVDAAKEQKKLTRSDVVNAALELYFNKKNAND